MKVECSKDGCGLTAKKRGLCGKHYLHARRHGRLADHTPMHRGNYPWRSVELRSDASPDICKASDCNEKPVARGFCRNCYTRMRRLGTIKTDQLDKQIQINSIPHCSVDGCRNKPKHGGLCSSHYHRKFRYGDPTFIPDRTKDRGRPKIDARGYRVLYKPGHPMARQNGYVFEHRLVVAEIIGRMLRPEENIHHVNGGRADNRRENLQLWTSSHPSGQRIQDLVAWAKEILVLYPDDLVGRLNAAVDPTLAAPDARPPQ